MTIDGHFDDWSEIKPIAIDETGDTSITGVDFGQLWATSDAERLYLSFEIGRERNLQSGNEIVLHMDTDDSPKTGLPIAGMGADVEWRFGERLGIMHAQSGEERFGPPEIASTEVEFFQGVIAMRQAPTVSSSRFEVSFARDSAVEGAALFPGRTIAIHLASTNDAVPDDGVSVRHRLSNRSPTRVQHLSLKRHHATDVRVMSSNVLYNGLVERTDDFTGIINAVSPDIICFQELFGAERSEVLTALATISPEAHWNATEVSDGCAIVSRFPILDRGQIGDNMWAQISVPFEKGGGQIVVINMHPPCCNNDEERQVEFDMLAAHIREIETTSSGIAPGTPIVITGDMNLVGLSRQQRTLIDGDILDEAQFGPDHPGDWDGTSLTDLEPRHVATRDNYTWRYDEGRFSPGRLDYMVYTDSVLQAENAFLLWTPDMTPEELEKWGLDADATPTASDHIPLVTDFQIIGE